MIPRSQDPNGPVAEQLASDPMLRESGFEAGAVTTPDGPAVYMVQTRQAFGEHAVLLTLPSGTSKGWRPWPPLMSNVKHHEGSGDRRSIDSTIRGSWRHRSISNRRCWPYICTAPQWMAAEATQ